MTTVVAAVIERDGKILIGQRHNIGPHALKWEFPGGKVESGETPEDGLVRELGEELAIRARVSNEIMRYEYHYPGRKPFLLVFFRVVEFEGEPRNLAFEQIQWTRGEELQKYDFLEGDALFIRSLLHGLRPKY
jgi:8-oxo-dGTP diphosphatase